MHKIALHAYKRYMHTEAQKDADLHTCSYITAHRDMNIHKYFFSPFLPPPLHVSVYQTPFKQAVTTVRISHFAHALPFVVLKHNVLILPPGQGVL